MKYFSFFLLFVCLIFTSFAQSVSDSKITGNLEEAFLKYDKNDSHKRENVFFNVNIVLKEQASYANFKEQKFFLTDKKSRKKSVIENLQKISTESQSSLLDYLIKKQDVGLVSEIKSLWIANVINCNASENTIREIAVRDDVACIDYDVITDDSTPDQIGDIVTKKMNPVSESTEIAHNVIQVNAPQVWEMGYEGQGIVVAVLDSGVNYNHEDLQGNLWESPDYPHHGWNFFNNNNNTMDNQGHGTHCAGTVAGNGASGLKTGMAPKAKIMILVKGMFSESSFWESVQFALENGADIMSVSQGTKDSHGGMQLWRKVMENVLSTGMIVSVAAGNETKENDGKVSRNITSPGTCPAPWINPNQPEPSGVSAAFTVGAIDQNNKIASFSSVGPVSWGTVPGYNDYPLDPGEGLIKPDISAPGMDVPSLSFSTNDGYVNMSGTSMATPGIAGIMALMLSKNNELTPEEIAEILETTAYKLTDKKSNTFGAGAVDAYEAVLKIKSGIFPNSANINNYSSDGTGKIKPGKNGWLDMVIKNITGKVQNNVTLTIESNSPYLTFTDNNKNIGNINTDSTIELNKVFDFLLSEKAVGTKEIRFIVTAKNDENREWKTSFVLPVNSPMVVYKGCEVDDSGSLSVDKILNSSENAIIKIKVENTGNEVASLNNIIVSALRTEMIMVNKQPENITIEKNSKGELNFPVTVSADSKVGDTLFFTVGFDLNTTERFDLNFNIIIGKLKALLINKSSNLSSGDCFASTLSKNNYSVRSEQSADEIKNIEDYSCVWYITGENLSQRNLREPDELLILNYTSSGGNIYMEGQKIWSRDLSPVLSLFNIKRSHSSDNISEIEGVDNTVTESMNINLKIPNSVISRISPNNEAFPIFKSKAPVFTTAIANNGLYNSIGTSVCFNLLKKGKDSTNNQDAILSRFLEIFELPSNYKEQVRNIRCSSDDGVNMILWDNPYIPIQKDNFYPKLLGFNVYRDGIKVNTDLLVENKFIDKDAPINTRIYEVSAVYDNGESEKIVFDLSTVGINYIDNNNLVIYPNPANDYIEIQTNIIGMHNIKIYNINGRIVKDIILYENKQHKLDISDLPSGVYMINISNGITAKSETGKLIIKR